MPTLQNALADTIGRVDQAFFYKVSDAFSGSGLTYSATLANGGALPSWLAFDDQTGRFAGEGHAGAFDVKVTATDASGAAASDVFHIDVGAQKLFLASAYGATTNDASDDTAALNAAIKAANAAGGGTVVLDAGTYVVSGTGNASDGAVQLLSNVTLNGAGMGQTIVKLKDGFTGDLTGIIRTPVGETTHDVGVFDLTIDGNGAKTEGRIIGFFIGVKPDDPRAAENAIVQRVEAENNDAYAIDPHEITKGLFILDNVSHNNVLDGFTVDYNEQTFIRGNLAYENGRHGFNIVTQSDGVRLIDNIARDNGATGFTIQRGGDKRDNTAHVSIEGGTATGNGNEGVMVKASSFVTVKDMLIEKNAWDGVRVSGADHVTIEGNTIRDNSQAASGKYDGVKITSYADSAFGITRPSENITVTSNVIAGGAAQYHFGVSNPSDGSDFISATGNQISGAQSGALSIGAAHQNSTGNTEGGSSGGGGTTPPPVNHAPSLQGTLPAAHATEGAAFSYTLPSNLFADSDQGDVLTLSAKTASGALPAWLKFDAPSGKFFGTPDSSAAGDVQITVTATDKGGLSAHGAFGLSIADSPTAPPPPPPPPPPPTSSEIRGTEAADKLVGSLLSESLFGLGGNDQLNGGAGNDKLWGGAGRDTLIGGAGNDDYRGGDGDDTISFAAATSGIAVNLASTAAQAVGGGQGSDKFESIENVAGSAFSDHISGDGDDNAISGGAGADLLNGGAGNDTLAGGDGNDVLNGGANKDTLIGGAGDDAFVFNVTPTSSNADTITDFNPVNDTFRLGHAVFSALGPAGSLSAAQFHVGAGAADANDHVIYNSANGALIYDANGNQAGGSVQIAQLQAHLHLSAADFVII